MGGPETPTEIEQEAPEAKAARERLTGALLLLALVLGVAAGVVTRDGGLGFGAFIAACLVGGMYLQRHCPPPNAEPPPRWGMVASFISGPPLIVYGAWQIVTDLPVDGAIRVVCGAISLFFAFDQRALRERRAEAIKALVRSGLREATLHVGAGWDRASIPRSSPTDLDPSRERVPRALAGEELVAERWQDRPWDLGGLTEPAPPPGGSPLFPPSRARIDAAPPVEHEGGGHWLEGQWVWGPPPDDDDDPPPLGGSYSDPDSDGDEPMLPAEAAPAAEDRPRPAPPEERAAPVLDVRPPAAPPLRDLLPPVDAPPPTEDELPPLPRRVRGASLFRPSRLAGSLETTADLDSPPDPESEAVEAIPSERRADDQVPDLAPDLDAEEPTPEPEVVAMGVADLDLGPGAATDVRTGEAGDPAVVDLTDGGADGAPIAAGAGGAQDREVTRDAGSASPRTLPLPRGIRVLPKRPPRPEFDETDDLL